MSEVAIKGVRQGLLLVLPDDGDWDAVLVQLDTKLAAATSLINGSKAQLEVGDRDINRERLEWLVGRLKAGYSLEVTALIGTHSGTQEAAEAIGLSLTVAPPPMAPERTKVATTPEVPVIANNALYLRQTVRSGQSIRHDGTIVICGDVNPGAEVIATGDIIVFGTLRGVAHAGAAGDEDCGRS